MGSGCFGVGLVPFNTMGTARCKSCPVGFLHPLEGSKQFIQDPLLPRLCKAAAELKGLSFRPIYDALGDFWPTYSLTQLTASARVSPLVALSHGTCQPQHSVIVTTDFHFPWEEDTLPDKLFEQPFVWG